ncbi:glutaredoxin family protein [Vibrio gallicus]|uniref:glutaredoxin family protein n=1 Tax=Vibrio gallicus TaxID=190897 RepID=UPI0021C344FA|nr:glutaredoxin family protein [Vibrio gallicus]
MIQLFSTQGCHLCEQALEMFMQIGQQVTVVDIAFDDELFSRYGVTIPVVEHNGAELNWPFNIEILRSWLETNGITDNT